MAPPRANDKTLVYRRTHNLLLGTRLLSQRGTPSPFTLLLDDTNQSSAPLVDEYILRAKLARISTVYVSFVTLRIPENVNTVINARKLSLESLQRKILSCTSVSLGQSNASTRYLVVIDSMNYLSNRLIGVDDNNKTGLALFLSSILSPSLTLLATYHMDVPKSPSQVNLGFSYSPEPLELLRYLCTTIIRVYSPVQVFAQKRALDKSLPLPSFGLDEGLDGSLSSLGGNIGWCDTCGYKKGSRAIILELEHRRMSGRSMTEWFLLSCHPTRKSKEKLILLEDHPLYNPDIQSNEPRSDEGDKTDLTFSLGLTSKQKIDRNEVVLPYFDAQMEGGGAGGRIVYVPGREDDWDEEEDEI